MAGFLNRWAQKKAGIEAEVKDTQAKVEKNPAENNSKDLVQQSSDQAAHPQEPKVPQDSSKASPETVPAAAPTLEDVLKLTKDSDFSAYVKPGIDPNVQQAALQKLFSDPRYNIMDGLDIYIDDYSKPDPIPLEMLKKLNQSKMLGLFKTAEEKLADLEAERLDQEDYQRRLQALESGETTLENSNTPDGQVSEPAPDESPSDINTQDSAKSSGLESNEEMPKVSSTSSIKSANKAGE